jgi:hypothetical protein
VAKKITPLNSFPLAEVVESRVMMSVAPHAKAAQPATLVDPVGGLTGTYYRGANFQQEVMTRNDASINFLWGPSAPDPSLVHRRFSVRWTGQITAQYSENYTFTTVADDGVRVWIGGKLIINDWQDQFATAARGTVKLEAGQTYDIRIDYFENGAPPAAIRLFWQSKSQPKQIVPTTAFHTNPTPGSVGSPNEGGAPSTVTAAPANLAATGTSTNTIHLSWSDVSGETGFVVQRSPDGQTGWTGVATIPAGQTSFDDTGLASGTTYFYQIIATNAAGPSAASNVASAATQGDVYGLTNDGKVERIDTATAAATQVGTLAFGTAAGDTDPTSGRIYYVEQNTSTPRVAVWDPTTNTNTTLATISVSGPVMRAAFNKQGVLYVTAGNGDLYTVDTTTGAAMFVGTIQYNGSPLPAPSGDMAFGADGSLYLDENSDLFKIDVNTLSATYVGNNGNIGNVQVAFGTDGLLYGAVADGSLYRVDTATGAATLVGNTDVYQIGDLAPVWG